MFARFVCRARSASVGSTAVAAFWPLPLSSPLRAGLDAVDGVEHALRGAAPHQFLRLLCTRSARGEHAVSRGLHKSHVQQHRRAPGNVSRIARRLPSVILRTAPERAASASASAASGARGRDSQVPFIAVLTVLALYLLLATLLSIYDRNLEYRAAAVLLTSKEVRLAGLLGCRAR